MLYYSAVHERVIGMQCDIAESWNNYVKQKDHTKKDKKDYIL